MKRRTRHVRARSGEWIQVHRGHAPGAGETGDWLAGWGLKIAGVIVAVVIAGAILSAVAPYLAIGAVCWMALKLFGRE